MQIVSSITFNILVWDVCDSCKTKQSLSSQNRVTKRSFRPLRHKTDLNITIILIYEQLSLNLQQRPDKRFVQGSKVGIPSSIIIMLFIKKNNRITQDFKLQDFVPI